MAPSRAAANRGPKLEPHQIILRPLVTEKGTHQFTHRNAYPFEVNKWANKDEIKAAIQRGIEQTQQGRPALLEFITQKEVQTSDY